MASREEFISQLNKLPMYVDIGKPMVNEDVIIHCKYAEAEKAVAIVEKESGAKVFGICYYDYNDAMRQKTSLNINTRIMNPHTVSRISAIRVICYVESNDTTEIIKRIANCNWLGIYTLLLYSSDISPRTCYRKLGVKYFEDNLESLLAAYDLLEDQVSRDNYLRYVKSRITGHYGYILRTAFRQYAHKYLTLLPGDVVIDGGISSDVSVTVKFAMSVGNTGKVYAFEPEPTEYEKAKNKFEEMNLSQIELVKSGLWYKNEVLYITQDGDGSMVCKDDDVSLPTSLCELKSLDDFVEAHNINTVNYIKLDIEGAELEALKGATKTIHSHRPNMSICLYHKNTDIFQIPMWVASLNLGYKLYVAQETNRSTGTVLHALSPALNCT